jgi:hypothetical protein
LKVDTANARVGINNQSPSAVLDVQASTGTAMRITNSGTGESFRVEDATSDITPFVIDASGNVGMGTATPLARLHITDGNANIRLNTTTPSADALNIVAPVAGANSRSLTLRPVTNMSSNNTLELPNTTGELAAFTSARGTNTAYTTYTPTLTQGVTVSTTVNVARYCQIGKKIHAQVFMTCTSSGTGGSQINFTLPQTSTSAVLYAGCMGTMSIYDVSANSNLVGNAASVSSTTVAMTVHNGTGYWGGTTLARGDFVMADLIYEVV